jgi:hypothetical protein|tara:strand:+ start:2560 stop:2700 length:141 start_codon:yes stop_codon:yes gene_type:complete
MIVNNSLYEMTEEKEIQYLFEFFALMNHRLEDGFISTDVSLVDFSG